LLLIEGEHWTVVESGRISSVRVHQHALEEVDKDTSAIKVEMWDCMGRYAPESYLQFCTYAS